MTAPIADAEFWTADAGTLATSAGDVPDGVSLFGPAHVELAQRTTLPTLVVRAGDLGALSMHGPVSFLAVDLDGKGAWANWSWQQMGDTPAPEQPDDQQLQELSSGLRSKQPETVELRELLGLPWAGMHLRVWALASDRASPPLDVRLEGAPAKPADAPEHAKAAKPGKKPIESTREGLRITPPKPGVVHVVVVGRRVATPELTTVDAKGPFVLPHPVEESFVSFVAGGRLTGPVRIPARAGQKKH